MTTTRAFGAETFTFHLDDGFTAVELDQPVSIAVEDLDAQLQGSGRLPDLAGAPVASWVLARVAELIGANPGSDEVEHVDDGVYVLDFVVEDDAPVAKLQLQGGAIGVGLLGVARRDRAREVVEALYKALLSTPTAVAVSSVRVVDDAGADRRYGYDGSSFLS